MYTLSYYRQQIGSMFRVRSWNNGVRCMSFCFLLLLYTYEVRERGQLWCHLSNMNLDLTYKQQFCYSMNLRKTKSNGSPKCYIIRNQCPVLDVRSNGLITQNICFKHIQLSNSTLYDKHRFIQLLASDCQMCSVCKTDSTHVASWP